MPKSKPPRKPQGPTSWQREERAARNAGKTVIDGETVPKSKAMVRFTKPAMAPKTPKPFLWRHKGKFALATGTAGGTAMLYRHNQPKQELAVAKASDWKTIDQRERQAAKARKTQRRSGPAIVTGASLAGGALYAGEQNQILDLSRRPGKAILRNGATTQASAITRNVRRAPGMGRKVKTAVRLAGHNPLGATLIGGGTLAGLGAVGYGQGKARENYHQSKINERRKANYRRTTVTKYFDPFSGDTYEFAKADSQPSTGRRVTAQVFPGWHGAFAGRKGKKARAFGNEMGPSGAVGIAGMTASSRLMAAGHNKSSLATSLAGAGASRYVLDRGVKRNQRKGYYKPEVAKAYGNGSQLLHVKRTGRQLSNTRTLTHVTKFAHNAFTDQPVTLKSVSGGHSRVSADQRDAQKVQVFHAKNPSVKTKSALHLVRRSK